MKTKKSIKIVALALCMTLCLSSCVKKILSLTEIEVPLIVSHQSVSKSFKDVEKRVKVIVKSEITESSEVFEDSKLNGMLRGITPHYSFIPNIQEFVQDATVAYMLQMRFDISPSAEYTLMVNIKTFKLSNVDKKTKECMVKLTYRLTNEAGETVIPTSSVITNQTYGDSEKPGTVLVQTYTDALHKIDWDRIADCLRIAKTAKQEKNAQVNGAGDTALEHTVIRWNILSSPQGADVYWRVISSTPDVANTNTNYVGTTPYESTEAFDIRGLSYNNSGNVQIEVSCEKHGYLTQRKRFNLRQVIDQKEISAKFNLVKEN